MTPANDNDAPRARLIPLLGSIDIDTGRIIPAQIPRLIGLPHGAVLGPIRWPAEVLPFPNDPREA